MLDVGAQVLEHAELRHHDRAGGVAVEALDLPVVDFEDVRARRVHPLARRRDDPGGKVQRAEVGALSASWTTTMLSSP